MPQSRTKNEFIISANLAQQVSKMFKRFDKEIFPLIAGSDPETSLKIGRLMVLKEHKLLGAIPEEDYKLIIDLLDMERLAKFATGQKVNEITVMGFLYPKVDPSFGDEED